MDFRWTPNKPLDPRIPERMRAAFPMPSEPPPDGAFWPRVKAYQNNLLAALEHRDEVQLMRYLTNTSIGVKQFERLDIWVQWFLYLLPSTIEMSYDVVGFVNGDGFLMGLQPDIIQFLMNIYLDSFMEEYLGFREDLLESVGQVVMSPQWWSSPDTLKAFFDNPDMDTEEVVEWGQFMGWVSNFRASMFFCLKYLKALEIAGWVDSIAAIEMPEWRHSVTDWLRAFKLMLYLLDHPEKVAQFHKLNQRVLSADEPDSAEYLLEIMDLSWWNSFIVFLGRPVDMLKTFFPADNLAAFWDAVSRHDWLREAVTDAPK